MMTLEEISKQTFLKILAAVGDSLPEQNQRQINQIVDTAIYETAVCTRQACAQVVKFHTGPEADIAHKIDENLRRLENALIENLKAMR
jgi:hypothetical protein